MLLGYEFHGSDAKAKLLGDKLELAPYHPCNLYRSIYDINFLPDAYIIPKRKNDFYASSDGFLLVSEKARQFCVKNKYRGLEFVTLPSTKYYWLKSSNVLKYDQSNKYLKLRKHRRKCDGYKEVSCPTPIFLKTKRPLADNFYRTDLCFGNEAKSPIMCVGVNTFKKIKKAGLTGTIFREIHTKYDPKQLPNWEIYKMMDKPDFDFLKLLGYKK